MDLSIIDHIMAGILVIVLPILGLWEYGRLNHWVEAGVSNARLRGYRWVMIQEWLLSFVVVGLWLSANRDVSALGLGFRPDPGNWIGVGLALAVSALLVMQSVVLLRNSKKLLEAKEQFEPMRPILPHNAREARAFAALSVTAGICEELLYRGFLIAYFTAIVGTWPAVLLSSLGFGLGHVYQGTLGVAKTGAIGVVLGALYVLTGSLWAPMLLHAVFDLNSGHLGRRAIELSLGREAT